jgi:hypothetical protein
MWNCHRFPHFRKLETALDRMTFSSPSDGKKAPGNLQLALTELQSDKEPTHKFISTNLVEIICKLV